MQYRYLLVAVLLALLATGAQAQGKFEGGPQKGTRTTSVSGSASYTAKDNYNATVRVELGYYTSPALEFAGVVALNSQGSPAQRFSVADGNSTVFQSSSSSSGLAVGAAVRYHFGRSKIIPYVGFAPQYDVINLSGSKTKQAVLIVTGGADFFIKPQQSIFAQLSAERFTRDGSTTARLEVGVKLFY